MGPKCQAVSSFHEGVLQWKYMKFGISGQKKCKNFRKRTKSRFFQEETGFLIILNNRGPFFQLQYRVSWNSIKEQPHCLMAYRFDSLDPPQVM